MVSYLIAAAIWSYRLRRAADWAWGSVANGDAPLAYELSTALACRAHLDVSSLGNGIGTVRESLTCYVWQSLRWGHVGCINVAEWQLHRFNFTGSSRDPRAGLGRVLAATRNTSLYSDQPSLFACLLSSLAPQSPISLRQSPQLDNGSDVVLLKSNGRKAGS